MNPLRGGTDGHAASPCSQTSSRRRTHGGSAACSVFLTFVFDKKIFRLDYYLKKNISTKDKITEILFYIKRILYFYKLYFKLG